MRLDCSLLPNNGGGSKFKVKGNFQMLKNLEESQNTQLDCPVLPWLMEMFKDIIVQVTNYWLRLTTARTRQAENIITKSVRKHPKSLLSLLL